MLQIETDFTFLAKNASNGERGFDAPWAAGIISSVDGYGCWCYFQDDHGKGKGAPQNLVDTQCKVLHDGYECVLSDAEAEGDAECVPWMTPYQSSVGIGMRPGTTTMEQAIRESCDERNPGDACGARACTVENYFVTKLFEMFLNPSPETNFDPSLLHSLGNFSPIDECVVNQNNSPFNPERECCSQYPLRFPYKPLGGARDCCGDKTYQTAVMSCCANDQISLNCDA